MAKVQAIQTKPGSRWAAYHDHKRIAVGDIVDIPGVDEEGFYVDDAGKRMQEEVLDKNGKPVLEKGKPKIRFKRLAWARKVGSNEKKTYDPAEAAAVLSGRNPGSKPAAEKAPEAKEKAK